MLLSRRRARLLPPQASHPNHYLAPRQPLDKTHLGRLGLNLLLPFFTAVQDSRTAFEERPQIRFQFSAYAQLSVPSFGDDEHSETLTTHCLSFAQDPQKTNGSVSKKKLQMQTPPPSPFTHKNKQLLPMSCPSCLSWQAVTLALMAIHQSTGKGRAGRHQKGRAQVDFTNTLTTLMSTMTTTRSYFLFFDVLGHQRKESRA